jgi:choice-of-anchor C domain-containing protein
VDVGGLAEKPAPDPVNVPPPQPPQDAEPPPVGPAVEVPGNLLVNGSFEEGPEPDAFDGYTTLHQGSTAIKGWVVSQGEIDYIGSFWQPADGRRSIDLNGFNRGAIRQTFKTTKDQRYRVTFSMAGVFHQLPAVKWLQVSAAGKSAKFAFDSSRSSQKAMGWMTRNWDFIAAADETTLEFASLIDGANGPALDRVSVVAVKEK